MVNSMSGFKNLAEYYQKYHIRFDIGIFVFGFLFDIVTLSRVDDPLFILQQVVYFVLLASILILSQKGYSPKWRWLAKAWEFRDFIFHFFLGSLLSVYTLFFFKSASFSASLGFVAFISILLIVNELPRFQAFGEPVKWGLLSLCLLSFFSILVPIVVGNINALVFLLGVIVTAFTLIAVWKYIFKPMGGEASNHFLISTLSVVALYVGLYFLNMVPPVPLAVEYIGIYHRVEKDSGQFHLYFERPEWKFWQNGAQTFLSRPGDQLNVYARVFSPAGFRDKIYLEWYWKNARGHWEKQDRIPLNISGGRDQGFRGYARKANYQPGRWQVRVMSSDLREMGRLSFEVINEPSVDGRMFTHFTD